MSVEDTSASDYGRGGDSAVGHRPRRQKFRKRRPSIKRGLLMSAALTCLLLISAGLWISFRIMDVKHHLTSAASLVSQVKIHIVGGNGPEARNLLRQVQEHTQAADAAVKDPLWKLSSHIPLIGQNFTAVSEIAEVADAVVTGAGAPLLNTADLLASGALTPSGGALDLALLEEASPGVVAVARTTEKAASRLESVERRDLLNEISGPLDEVTRLLQDVRGPLNVAAQFTELLPGMLGSVEPRNYLVLIQNNAELRSTGGLAGALAVVRIDHGKVELTGQATATELGRFAPRIPVDPEQERIFSTRLGTQISGVNLTPDFPTTAQTAKVMWETRYGTVIDGVVAIDPIVLSHILAVSGPLPVPSATDPTASGNLPATLTAENVVQTLLSDVYMSIDDNRTQDQFFASAAQQIFEALAAGKAPGVQLVQALAQSSEENRLHVWSQREAEQTILKSTGLGGSISSGPDVGKNSFGAYFNDGTGAKMDYHVKRTVQLVQECTGDDYGQVKVRITSTNNVAADAATSLPVYVTGGGLSGVPAGTVRTNVIAYGPVEANVETAEVDGKKVGFAANRHGNRPVGTVTVTLAPGQSNTVEITFGKIFQHTEPTLVVTPTVQAVKEVVLATEPAVCPLGK
jgi:hypothetical protein